MIRILIADDHAVVRKGLRQILAEEPDFAVIGEAASSTEVLAHLRKAACDILILDINMPHQNGIELTREIKNEFPKIAILILSMHSEDQFGVRALRNGASGYMTKDSDPDELLVAIRKLAGGRKYITPKLAELLELELHHKEGALPHEELSDREFSVFRALARGKSVRTIAEELFLSAKTVSNYRARALAKMNLKTTAEIIVYAHQHNILD